MRYYRGRRNLACTIFVPFKCGNNCPFCNTNYLYDNFEYSEETLEKMLLSIEACNKSDAVNEFVITGGEPLMDLGILKEIVSAMDKPVYINTSLPLVPDLDACIDYINSEDKIHGVNVSRHLNTVHDVKTAGLEHLDKIKKPVRVNCIINESMLGEKIESFIKMYATPYRLVNFRADYRYVTPDTLKNRDAVSLWMLDHFRFEASNNCMVCNSEFYSDEASTVVCYHRGLEHSSLTFGDRTYVNDILIDMHGDIYRDWDMTEDPEFNDALTNRKVEL